MIFIGIGIGKSCLNMAAATQSTIRLGQLNRSLSTTASMNGLASFVRKTLFGSEEEKSPVAVKKVQPLKKTPRVKLSKDELEERVRNLAATVLPPSDDAAASLDWTSRRIDNNLEMKSKILSNCENNFGRKVPNTALRGMSTLGDLVTFFHNPPSPPPDLLFPDLRNETKLPANLSVQIPSERKEKKRNRVPFQNYNDPKHKDFPNKKELFRQYEARYRGKK